MKAKKWIFGIITIMVCITAISVGVYSARKVHLNFGGGVNFSIHKCMLDFSCNITGGAESTDYGFSKTDITKSCRVYSSDAGRTENSMELPALNFYRSGTGVDGIDPIYMELTFTNLLNNIVEATITVDPNGTLPSSVIYSSEQTADIFPFTFWLGANESATYTIKFEKTSLEALSNIALNLNCTFDEYTPQTLTDLGYTGSYNSTLDGYEITGVPSGSGSLVIPRFVKHSDDSTKTIVKLSGSGSISSMTNVLSYSKVLIPNSVIEIGIATFHSFSGKINLPQSITSIGGISFYNSSAITNKMIENLIYLTSIGNNAFYNNANIVGELNLSKLSSLTTISGFAYCSSITSVILPESVTELFNAFNNCTSLNSINMPASITSIGTYSFQKTLLTNVVVPNVCRTLGEGAFNQCYYLTRVVLPYGLQIIGDNCFANCNELYSIDLPDSLTTLGTSVFSGTPISTLTIPNSVTQMSLGVLSELNSLTNLTLPFVGSTRNSANFLGRMFNSSATDNSSVPSSLTIVDVTDAEMLSTSTFRDCTSLQIVYINNKIDTIPTRCFYGCTSLKYVPLMNVRFIRGEAFANGPFYRESLGAENSYVFVGPELEELAESAFDFHNLNGSGNDGITTIVYLGSTGDSSAPSNVARLGFIELSESGTSHPAYNNTVIILGNQIDPYRVGVNGVFVTLPWIKYGK